MMKIAYLYSVSFILLLSFSACTQGNNKEKKKEKISVAVAANMQFAMEELAKQFADSSGIQCDLIVSSSGKLTAQIKEGAPFDVFVAANMKYPEEVAKNGKADSPPKEYAYGKLVLWSMVPEIDPSLTRLADESIKHIAVANPKTAPYGEAALEVLNYYNLAGSVEQKLVFGESIAQTNQFITTQSAELGFTAMSVVLSPKMRNKGRWTAVDDRAYTPIKQGVVLIKGENRPSPAARQFYQFLFSPAAKKILQDYGYAVSD